MKKDFVTVTLVEYKGSVPQALGAKAKVELSGLVAGTVGGGKVEAKAILFAQEMLRQPDALKCRLITWNLTLDVGMTCGGVVTFLFELDRHNAWKIAVFGAGHVAQELVPLLLRLECSVTCIDSRAEWLDRIPLAENLIKKLAPKPEVVLKDLSEDCFFILMTQGHATDLPILAEILRTREKAPFIGVIGSKTKALSLQANLKAMDFSKEKIESFHCPIGLAIGNNTPVEISYSIIAQLLQVRDYALTKKGDLR